MDQDNKIKLNTKHPVFASQEGRYSLWSDLFEGAVEKKKEYLPQHPYEKDTQYGIKLERSTYRNFAAPVVQIFSSTVFMPEPKRELPQSLETLRDNVDLGGTNANRFFQDVATQAAASGLRYVLVDMPPKSGKTLEDDIKTGRRPYFVSLPVKSVIDWSHDEKGNLVYAVIAEEVEVEAEPFRGHKKERRYKLWMRDKWQLWRVNKKDEPEMVDEGLNELGEIPLVPFYFEQVEPMVGKSATASIASLCKSIYRRDCELDKALFDAAVAVMCFYGFSEDEVGSFVKSSSNGLRTNDTNARVEYTEPSGASFGALRDAINKDEASIREIALRQVRPDSAQIESAESKKIDGRQLDSQIMRFSKSIQRSEQRCWELMAKWIGETGAIEIDYSKEFNLDLAAEKVVRVFSDLRRNQDLSRETMWDMLKKLGYLSDKFDPVEEQTKIEAENRATPALAAFGSAIPAASP